MCAFFVCKTDFTVRILHTNFEFSKLENKSHRNYEQHHQVDSTKMKKSDNSQLRSVCACVSVCACECVCASMNVCKNVFTSAEVFMSRLLGT